MDNQKQTKSSNGRVLKKCVFMVSRPKCLCAPYRHQLDARPSICTCQPQSCLEHETPPVSHVAKPRRSLQPASHTSNRYVLGTRDKLNPDLCLWITYLNGIPPALMCMVTLYQNATPDLLWADPYNSRTRTSPLSLRIAKRCCPTRHLACLNAGARTPVKPACCRHALPCPS